MKKTALYIGFFLLFVPQVSLAQTHSCSEQGYTVVFINGAFSDFKKAFNESNELRNKLGFKFKGEDLSVKLAYNPSHLAGAGDLGQALAQEFSYSVSNYDLHTMLMQIYPEVTTRKLLLVGHSQGTYYSNELYNYLLAHGVPKEAVDVYNVGSPAPVVAGGGNYLNSSSDTLLIFLRETLHFGTLPTNIFISLDSSELANNWPGHSFVNAYLKGAPERIVSDISDELAKLKPTYSSDTEGCFTPPEPTVGYQTQHVLFTVADPAAGAVRVGGTVVVKGSLAVVNTAYTLALAAAEFFSDSISVVTSAHDEKKDTQKTFELTKKLYGSSLNKEDFKELVGDSQGGAVALAFPKMKSKPIEINGGFVEGTSTGPVDTETESTTSVLLFIPAPSGPTQALPPNDAPQPDNSSGDEVTGPVPPIPPTPPQLVINEIEWAGDAVSSEREWIELKNLSNEDVDLTGLALVATEGGSQYIPLTGTMDAGGYFVVQRDLIAPLNPANNSAKILQVYPFDQLSDAGEQLSLVQVGDWGTTTIDSTPPVSACGGWCAGKDLLSSGLNATLSMERVDAHASGEISSIWASNDTYTASANMPGGNNRPLYATVAAENSKNILQDYGWFCSPDTTPISPGQHYAPPPGSLCTYLARFIPWQTPIWSGLFKGTVGSSTIVSLHTTWTGTSNQVVEGIGPDDALPGDDYFAAVWGLRTGMFPQPPDNQNFQSYFTTGHLLDPEVTDPPTDNYRVIPFIYEP